MSIGFTHPAAVHHAAITLLSRQPLMLLLLLLLLILLRIQRLHATALLSAIFIFGNGRQCRVIVRSIAAATTHHHGLDETWLHHDRMRRLTVTLFLAADGAIPYYCKQRRRFLLLCVRRVIFLCSLFFTTAFERGPTECQSRKRENDTL